MLTEMQKNCDHKTMEQMFVTLHKTPLREIYSNVLDDHLFIKSEDKWNEKAIFFHLTMGEKACCAWCYSELKKFCGLRKKIADLME